MFRFKHSVIVLILGLAMLASACDTESPRVTEDFNFGWTFQLGDNAAWASTEFDDNGWRRLHLPHDWSIEGEFSRDNPSTPGGGALPGGTGWYRKHFPTPEGVGEGSRRLFIEFDGVFMNSTVYVNGIELGTRPYGYSSFTYDMTPVLNAPGEDNVIAVRCDNEQQPNSRWYAGCGIYRNVRTVEVNAAHIVWNSLYVTTPEVSADNARICASAEMIGAKGAHLEFRLLDSEGRVVASSKEGTFSIRKPHLWDTENPYLYGMEARLLSGNETLDVCLTTFGIRSMDWDEEEGFSLNGQKLKIQGVCLHHDMGCLGTAVHRRALERELTIMKDMGANAIRTSHNPPAPDLLEICDEMGFVVMDEAFDMWRLRKTEFDYSRFFDEWHVRDLQDFVRRDRNHPCVVMWSLGNEIGEQSSPDMEESMQTTRHLADLVRELDTTRVITAGCDGVWPGNNLLRSGALDVFGFNYHPQLYDSCHMWFPDTPLIGSETVSSLNSRGIYFQPSTNLEKHPEQWWMPYETEHHQCTSYDACCAPWANYHEEAWKAVRDRSFMAGAFVWTGFDYLGEPTPYGWPSRSSYFGIVDLAGFPKDAYYLYQSEWTDKTVLHLFPHWNWAEGDSVDVWAYYNNADEVELFVNGTSIGRCSKTDEVLHAQWLGVPFVPGRIEVVSYKNGDVVEREACYTSGEAERLKLEADRGTICADGYDLCYVTVEALDADGRPVPDAANMLHFEVSGAGELVGVDNGNAADTLSLKGHDKALFSGKALAVVRSIKGEQGTATLSVSSSFDSVKLNIATE